MRIRANSESQIRALERQARRSNDPADWLAYAAAARRAGLREAAAVAEWHSGRRVSLREVHKRLDMYDVCGYNYYSKRTPGHSFSILLTHDPAGIEDTDHGGELDASRNPLLRLLIEKHVRPDIRDNDMPSWGQGDCVYWEPVDTYPRYSEGDFPDFPDDIKDEAHRLTEELQADLLMALDYHESIGWPLVDPEIDPELAAAPNPDMPLRRLERAAAAGDPEAAAKLRALRYRSGIRAPHQSFEHMTRMRALSAERADYRRSMRKYLRTAASDEEETRLRQEFNEQWFRTHSGPASTRRRLAAEGRLVARNAKKPPLSCDPSARPLPASALGKSVKIHLNLHNGCYVVSHKGKVLGYTRSLELEDVSSNVSLAGYRRCREEMTRNVHAWLVGTLVSMDPAEPSGGSWRKLSYNCLTAPPCFFYVDTHSCFVSAQHVKCFPRGQVWAR